MSATLILSLLLAMIHAGGYLLFPLPRKITPPIEILTTNEILAHRVTLLGELGVTEKELRDKNRDNALTPKELGILSEINGMDFLLGETDTINHLYG